MSARAFSWSGRRVLVTGAGGFIGSHVVEHVARGGADVVAFVRYNSRNDHGRLEEIDVDVRAAVDVFTGDLGNPEAVAGAMQGADTVLHLGALIPIPYSYRHPREFVTANVEGTLNVLEAARRSDIRRLVHLSTSEVYGTAQIVPIPETHPIHPQSPYAATKAGADQLANAFQLSYGLSVVTARPFNTFGPRQSARAVIPTIAAQALSRDVVELGALEPTRDFVYVENTAAGIIRCAEVDGVDGQTFNLGSGSEISIGDLARRILAEIGRDVEIAASEARLRPEGSEVDRLVADASKARDVLGWVPDVGLDAGLRLTIAWVERTLDRLKPAIYNV